VRILFVFSGHFSASDITHNPWIHMCTQKGIAPIITALSLSGLVVSCTSLRLQHVDYAWPVESVQIVDESNKIEEVRYSLSLDVTPLALEEFQDSVALRGKALHIIRNSAGYYFITGPQFKHVYVFESGASELSLQNKLEVTQAELHDPALNQRTPYVELIDGPDFSILLTSSEILERKNQ